ncbi:MAG: VOC family protein [Thermomonas sp.]
MASGCLRKAGRSNVDSVCAAYASQGAEFGNPVPELGNARTAPLASGGLIGIRGPLRDSEQPVVRPYWLVEDIESAVAAIQDAGGTVAVPPMELPERGRFAIMPA